MSSKYPKYENYGSKYGKDKKPSYYEKIVNFFMNMKRIMKTANKPSRKDYFTVFKIVLIGMILLGVISFVIQLILNTAMPIAKAK
ncbi:MAG: protein translocase SEC61 complex subunit gamma [Candidatus Lokiarchaeota archaeon]|nr:protein translocase SEC61 complex subunit gamma [Candidatus Lokiarchaeota archaeon]